MHSVVEHVVTLIVKFPSVVEDEGPVGSSGASKADPTPDLVKGILFEPEGHRIVCVLESASNHTSLGEGVGLRGVLIEEGEGLSKRVDDVEDELEVVHAEESPSHLVDPVVSGQGLIVIIE